MKRQSKSWYDLNPRPNVKPIRTRGGCKVGWETFATREEAELFATWARKEAAHREEQGYDFGYCSPGSIKPVEGGFEVCTA